VEGTQKVARRKKAGKRGAWFGAEKYRKVPVLFGLGVKVLWGEGLSGGKDVGSWGGFENLGDVTPSGGSMESYVHGRVSKFSEFRQDRGEQWKM